MKKTTEQASNHDNLELKSIEELLVAMNQEDSTVPLAVAKEMTAIKLLCEKTSQVVNEGGRIFYMGSGTSGRLGVVDASECPPTFGVSEDLVVGIIAGGDKAIRKAVEMAEDDTKQGWKDLLAYAISPRDIVIGLSASGTTPYVLGALESCRANNIPTGCIVCNKGSLIAELSDYPVEVVVGPEFVTGSTRMKSGTAQKLVLNMISTTSMIKRGHVIGNKMVDMQLSNDKLVDRGTKMIMDELAVDYAVANDALLKHGSVRKAVESLSKNK